MILSLVVRHSYIHLYVMRYFTFFFPRHTARSQSWTLNLTKTYFIIVSQKLFIIHVCWQHSYILASTIKCGTLQKISGRNYIYVSICHPHTGVHVCIHIEPTDNNILQLSVNTESLTICRYKVIHRTFIEVETVLV